MPPHPALLNADILHEIFHHAAPSPECDPDQRTLLAGCARVCKAFLDPAARTLWARIPSIFALLDVINPPLSLVDEGRAGECTPKLKDTYVLMRPVTIEEWTRFCYYASYVRILAPDPKPKHGRSEEDLGATAIVSPSVWTYLARYNSYQPLLPAIRCMQWEITNPSATELLYIVSPTLRRMHLRMSATTTHADEEWDQCLAMLLRSATELTPALSRLTISSKKSVPIRFMVMEVSECDLKDLRALELELENEAQALPLGLLHDCEFDTLEQLEDLKLGVVDSAEYDPLIAPMKHPTLKSLTLVDYSGKEAIYRGFELPRLRSLAVVHRTRLQPSESRDICEIIASRFRTLTSIHIHFDPPSTPFNDRTSQLTDAIQPLFNLREIQEAYFDLFGMEVIMNDADVFAILNAWPRLKKLSLKHPWLSIEDAPGIPSLLAVARDAPEMEELQLSHLYLSPADLESALQVDPAPCNPALRSLKTPSLLDETGKRFPEVCALLNQLFPSLDIGQSHLEEPTQTGSADRNPWEKVVATIAKRRADLQMHQGWQIPCIFFAGRCISLE